MSDIEQGDGTLTTEAHADCVAPPSADFVRQYLRANLFDGHEGGVLTVKISDHLDFLTELVIDLFSTIWEDETLLEEGRTDG